MCGDLGRDVFQGETPATLWLKAVESSPAGITLCWVLGSPVQETLDMDEVLQLLVTWQENETNTGRLLPSRDTQRVHWMGFGPRPGVRVVPGGGVAGPQGLAWRREGVREV